MVADQSEIPFVLQIVGDGVLRLHLEELAISLGLSARVEFVGWVERTDIASYYQSADIFVTASVWEGMPNTVLEAMACGLPIIAAKAHGCEDLVRRGENGYLVPQRDVAAMAEAILYLLEDGMERRRMGRVSRRIVEQTFAWDQIAAAYVGIYERIVGVSGSGGPDVSSGNRPRSRPAQ